MRTVTRVVGVMLFLVFVSVVALRPLVANPTVSAALTDGGVSRQALLILPLVLVSLLIVALRMRSTNAQSTDNWVHPDHSGDPVKTQSLWEQRESDHTDAVENRGTQTEDAPERVGDANRPDPETDPADEPANEGLEPHPLQPNILAGQGGSRNRGFEIEERPPDARLSDHLEHLQAELGDDESVAADLENFEAVASEEGERKIPERCPQDHCTAVWSGRTVLGFNREKYEQLDDDRIQCLECESITTLPEDHRR